MHCRTIPFSMLINKNTMCLFCYTVIVKPSFTSGYSFALIQVATKFFLREPQYNISTLLLLQTIDPLHTFLRQQIYYKVSCSYFIQVWQQSWLMIRWDNSALNGLTSSMISNVRSWLLKSQILFNSQKHSNLGILKMLSQHVYFSFRFSVAVMFANDCHKSLQ